MTTPDPEDTLIVEEEAPSVASPGSCVGTLGSSIAVELASDVTVVDVVLGPFLQLHLLSLTEEACDIVDWEEAKEKMLGLVHLYVR